MEGKNILLGVTGGIAAYKAANLVSLLSKEGANVQVIMTKSAAEFITPLTLQTLSGNYVMTDTFDEKIPNVVSHIDAADRADIVVIAPATANVIGKFAHGIADDMLTTTLLAVTGPILFAPAMNVNMYHNKAVQKNIEILRNRGIYFIEPEEGMLACGYIGKGRLAEPEKILMKIKALLSNTTDFSGKKFLITAGATREPIDPVRFFTNRSTGKMGYALAEAARERGGEVILISGKTNLTPPTGVNFIKAETAEEMYQEVMAHLAEADVIIKAAAVADYRPKTVFEQKFKKTDGSWIIEMERTKDIAVEIGNKKREDQFFVGFSAETDQLVERAKGKLARKNMDMIVANNVLTEGAGFEQDTNIITIITKTGGIIDFPKSAKKHLAHQILDEIKGRIK